ncbi:hypothetical protein SAMN05444671_1117 [Flavobacterium sp. CF108]|nr:hypothetical protein SAMN04487978_0747 [Flavobacterium sp. fv08]SHG66323.1 hypothetical protein SAMN05444671_1117 [Flavobacterium sp. CF108]
MFVRLSEVEVHTKYRHNVSHFEEREITLVCRQRLANFYTELRVRFLLSVEMTNVKDLHYVYTLRGFDFAQPDKSNT